VCIGATALLALSTQSTGDLAGYSLLSIGLMNAIMFPTIFSLACEGLGPRAADGSGVINIAIFGGAVVPLATGLIVDATGSIAAGLMLPAACYVVIAVFGWFMARPDQAIAAAASNSPRP
jgi:FHS family L-fucose permease-like MFS transporter